MTRIKKAGDWIEKNASWLLWATMACYVIIVFAFLAAKYHSFGYNGIDLGIYNQVFFNTAHGRWFEFSIHPNNYLGDHFELFIIVLLPLYYLWQSPLALLLLQAIAIAMAAWPLFKIANIQLNKKLSLAICIIFLCNPLVLNAIFFEFHLLPFAVVLLLWAYYFYRRNIFFLFMLMSTASLLVREDVALVIAMFGLVALFEKRKLRWIVAPMILGAGWLILATRLIGYFNHASGYKFFSYYSWLGNSPLEIISHVITQPLTFLNALFGLNSWLIAAGLLLPLAATPLLKPKYLIPSALILLQLFLSRVGSQVVLETHYAILIIPFLFIATIAAVADLIAGKSKTRRLSFISGQKPLFSLILLAAALYSFITLGPLPGAVTNMFHGTDTAIPVAAIKQINASDSAVGSFGFLPQLSSREQLYSLHYAFLGKRQFSDQDYSVSWPIDKIIVDFNDFIFYNLQSQNISVYASQYPTGPARIAELIKKNNLCLLSLADTIAVYGKECGKAITLFASLPSADNAVPQTNTALDDSLHFRGWTYINQLNADRKEIAVALYWQAMKKITRDYQLQLALYDNNHEVVYKKTYPLGYGIYPSSQWPTGQIVRTNYWFTVPEQYRSTAYTLSLQVIDVRGYMGLDRVRSVAPQISSEQFIGEPILFTYNTL